MRSQNRKWEQANPLKPGYFSFHTLLSSQNHVLQQKKGIRAWWKCKRVTVKLITYPTYDQQVADVWELGVNLVLRLSGFLSIKLESINDDQPDAGRERNRNQWSLGLDEAPISCNHVSRAFAQIGKVIGIILGTHSMRKNRGYHLYKSTNDIASAMKMLRHSS